MPNGFESFMQGAMALGQRWQDSRDASNLATALDGYDKDPDAAISRATAEDPQYGMALRQQQFENKRQTTTDKYEAENHSVAMSDHARAIAKDGLTTLSGYLAPVAMAHAAGDKTADLGRAFDSMVPIMTGSLGMKADEINNYRQMFVDNPQMVLRNLEDYKMKVVSPGQSVVRGSPGGGVNVLYQNQPADKVITARGGDGSSHIFAVPASYGGNATPRAVNIPGSVTSVDGVNTPGATSGGGGGGGGLSNAGDLNNPGGLKDGPWARKQPGYKGAQRGFAVFDSPENGAAAQETLLRNRYVGRTPETLLNGTGRPGTGYSPDSDHGGDNTPEQTTNYASYLRTHVGSGPYTAADVPRLAQAMREWETGHKTGASVAAPAAAAPREIATTQGKPTQFTQLTDQDVASAGLNPNVKWQRGPDGKISMVGPANQLTSAGNNPNSKAYQSAMKARAAFPQLSASIDDMISVAQRLRDHPGLAHITGMMGALPNLPGGQASNAQALLESLKGKLGIEALQTMRSLSPTGGALGRVTNYEMQQLQNSLAPLDRHQSLDAMKGSLNGLIGYLGGLKGRLHDALPPDPSKPNQVGPSIHPQAIQMLRKNPNAVARQQFDQVFGQGMAAKVLGN